MSFTPLHRKSADLTLSVRANRLPCLWWTVRIYNLLHSSLFANLSLVLLLLMMMMMKEPLSYSLTFLCSFCRSIQTWNFVGIINHFLVGAEVYINFTSHSLQFWVQRSAFTALLFHLLCICESRMPLKSSFMPPHNHNLSISTRISSSIVCEWCDVLWREIASIWSIMFNCKSFISWQQNNLDFVKNLSFFYNEKVTLKTKDWSVYWYVIIIIIQHHNIIASFASKTSCSIRTSSWRSKEEERKLLF